MTAILCSCSAGAPPERGRVQDIIAKSLAKQPLSVEETAALLRTDDPELLDSVFQTAQKLKETVYGNRIVLFAPLYVGNDCVNDCSYCGFQSSNTALGAPHSDSRRIARTGA